MAPTKRSSAGRASSAGAARTPSATDGPVTAAAILRAIRKAYPKSAVVREVVMEDPFEMAIIRRHQLNGRHARFYKHLELGLEVADVVPDGWVYGAAPATRRIDALLRDSNGYTAIEIKISRADFARDTEEKRRAWKAHARRFIYATPVGLVTPAEVPAGCGLWEFDGARLASKKKATINHDPRPLPRQVIDAMLYRVSNYEKAA